MAEREIVIVGGGFTGTALAIHLARLGHAGLRVTVIEPRERLGQGVAYSTDDPTHRINVPASRMQLSAEEEGAFDRWYRASDAFIADPDAQWSDGSVYPQRGQFGRYIAAQFDHQAEHAPVRLVHVRDRAVALDNGVVVTASGERYRADELVLAISHPPPALPKVLTRSLSGHRGVIANPWQQDALARVGKEEQVAIMGSGLTMSDVVASLHRQGHRGKITVFSRRGQLPRDNLSGSWDARPLDYQQSPTTVRGWLRRIRREVALGAKENLPWQRVLDDIRLNGQRIWQQLPLKEQQRFLRHLRPWWDVHRYRIAPQVSAVLELLQISGQLTVLAARLERVERKGSTLALTLARREGTQQTLLADRLIITTGPAQGALLNSDALLSQLAAEGVIQADPLALGIRVDDASRTVNAQGQSNAHLWVAGPAARGHFGELMGLPQVAEHAVFIAHQLLGITSSPHQERCPASLTN
ncbi:FAD/NAD(P)-binding protein [Erwinia sp. ErVv1]|uniref:FAD/NAD(P)-binding protein n=1 Tax=Erwinia sp. ErVv1 TaxID=1603299 RepID=UPI00082CC49C|nr:FAD-dependent oxidoreductase [Erwinia sp. ErVv1]